MNTLTRALLPAILAFAALWTASTIAIKAAKQNASSVWPSTPGVVVQADVIPGGTAENLIHDLAFRTVYQTKTGSHELHRVTNFGRLGTYFRGGPAALSETFVPGDVVMVHYNPNNHAEAVVGIGLTTGEMYSAGAVIFALLAIGLACALASAEPFFGNMVSHQSLSTHEGSAATRSSPFNRSPAEPKPFAHASL